MNFSASGMFLPGCSGSFPALVRKNEKMVTITSVMTMAKPKITMIGIRSRPVSLGVLFPVSYGMAFPLPFHRSKK